MTRCRQGPHDLAVVMPVYNEEECIEGVVRSWMEMLARLAIDFRLIVLDDGSIDRTPEILAGLAADPRVDIIHKNHTGHGPTILLGYRRAVSLAQWVFQCDSDDELSARHFPALWAQRERYDFLLGVRVGRKQSPGRRLLTVCSHLLVRVLFGEGIKDANVPYRLARASVLQPIADQIPDDAFAPNVLMSAAIARRGLTAYAHDIPQAQTKKSSILGWGVWRAAWKCCWQTLRYWRGCEPVDSAQ